mmetsp:Transcript_6103/g.11963  ORF Transcript_6103/g.11963 Transcript_6103/m.11963 type:complete len:250 (-) Transcript_6103:1073-1822(-)
MIPSKQCYLEAFRHSAQLVETESNPLHFLRTEDFNPWQAAKRLALHWEYRKWLFQDRWLRSLADTTGNGALAHEDIETLNSGWIAYVAQTNNESSDQPKGRYFLMDHGKSHGHTLASFLRVLFYLGTLATDSVAQTAGATSIRLVSTSVQGEPLLDVNFLRAAQTAWKMGREALPYRVKRAIFLKVDDHEGQVLSLYLGRIASSVSKMLSRGHDSTTVTLRRDRARHDYDGMHKEHAIMCVIIPSPGYH